MSFVFSGIMSDDMAKRFAEHMSFSRYQNNANGLLVSVNETDQECYGRAFFLRRASQFLHNEKSSLVLHARLDHDENSCQWRITQHGQEMVKPSV